MIGKPEKNKKICPLCSGQLREGLATIPFVLDSIVAVVKDVPAEICEECDESYMKGDAVDRIEELLQNLKNIVLGSKMLQFKKRLFKRFRFSILWRKKEAISAFSAPPLRSLRLKKVKFLLQHITD